MKKNPLLNQAIHDGQSERSSKRSLLDRLFTTMFKNLVYPQIWEDPEVDLAALELKANEQVVTIASGGCNVLNYLTEAPVRITAVDLNTAHIALNRLKKTALETLPSYASFFRFFGLADDKINRHAYRHHIAPQLDAESRTYWEARTLRGQRIGMFTRNFYRNGLLGKYIGLMHLLCRLHGKNPRRLLTASTREEQRWLFQTSIGLMFNSPLVRWGCKLPVALYGLGIPPAQFNSLKLCADGDMAGLLHDRLERLACDFDIHDNYFAWQAFGRCYDHVARRAVPRYLEPSHYEALQARSHLIEIKQATFTDHLRSQPDQSVDAFVLLDAQDWMSDKQLMALWSEINRTASPKARVIFRTAGEETILPGQVPSDMLEPWEYHRQRSLELHKQDRSSIYGGFHLYTAR